MRFNNLSSLAKEFFNYAVIISILIFTTFIWISWYGYRDLTENRFKNYTSVSKSIQQSLSDSFKQVLIFTEFFANKIKDSSRFNKDIVYDIFNSRPEVSKLKEDILPWTMFEFINESGEILVTNGSNKDKTIPVTSSKREWIETARKYPWKLHISNPDFGIVSGEYIIPAGFGVTSDDGKFLGIISVGFEIAKLKRKLSKAVNLNDVYYLVLNHNLKIIASSYEDNIDIILRKIKNFSSADMLEKAIVNKQIFQDDLIFENLGILKPYNFIVLLGSKKSDIKAKLDKFIILHAVKSIILGISFMVLLYFFRSKIVKPILALSNYAIEISEANFNCITPPVNSVETANLLKAINMVKVSLQNELEAQTQLAEINHKMQLLNFELEEKVQSRTNELQKALTAKTDFLNNISHEIRTPIHGFTSISQGIIDHWENFDDAKKFSLAKHVAKSAKCLANIINNLLDLSKFSSNRMVFDFCLDDINLTIENAISEAKIFHLDNNKNIDFQFTSLVESKILFDKNRISQVFRNLITNAIKFSETDNVIKIKAEYYEKNYIRYLLCSVSDQGLGIPQDEISSIFDAFWQSSRTKKISGGTGLGLSICKEIVEAHNGEIWVENNLDKGCVFKFTIPIQS